VRLFSYCVKTDDGAAPNPYWRYCTLVICKPAIRRVAEVGDWVVGTGSRHALSGNLSGRVIYSMKVTAKIPMAAYDSFVRKYCPGKRPSVRHGDWRRQLGDAIYEFKHSPPRVRPSVHDEDNRKRDLSGEYALISEHFWYFGRSGPTLPPSLLSLAQQRRGHRVHLNDPLRPAFLRWIARQGRRGVRGLPANARVPCRDVTRSICD
jgi:putative DNA base modification enzyme with NMAD domain